MTAVRDPRHVVWTVLEAVDSRAAYANLLLPALLRDAGLAPRDAAFATDLTYTTLRWRGLCDAVIASAARRSVTAIDAANLNVLRLATASSLLLQTPAHAVVATGVSLAGIVGSDVRGRGFVNAVLRRVTERDIDAWRAEAIRGLDDQAALAVAYSHPDWVVASLRDALVHAGRTPADLAAVLEADNAAVRPTLAARPGLCAADELLHQPGSLPGRWARTAVHLAGGSPASVPAVAEHRAAVQDEGSQLVALIAAGVSIDGSDRRWLDACAGPGGKAALLGALAAQQGASVTAVERQEHRVRLVRAAVSAMGSVDVVHADATAMAAQSWYRDGMFDRVLLDVPCTGLGALRRRPDLRWHRRPRDVAELAPLQQALFMAGARAVRPGGVIVYSTCSPHVAETAVVTAKALRELESEGVRCDHVDLRVELPRIANIEGSALAASMAGRAFLQLWPDTHGTDAMYVSVWRRR